MEHIKCVRCGKDFPVSSPVRNVEYYVRNCIYACPFCGKAYQFLGKVSVEIGPIDDYCLEHTPQDDWNREIVKDRDYEKGL